MSNLALRTISGFVMAVVFLGAIYLGGWVFAALMGFVCLAIWFEWTQINLPDADDRLYLIGIVALLALMFFSIALSGLAELLAIIAILGGACALVLMMGAGRAGVLGVVYAGAFFVAMTQLRGHSGSTAGLIAIVYLCAVVWATDIGAYFVGRAVGGPKLAPTISPNKTISGAVGGVLCANFFAGLVVWLAQVGHLFELLVLAAFLSVLSQSGDLYESWLKRRAGVKDSSALIPGHGGVMDRVDGLVFAAISLWVLLVIWGGFKAPAQSFFS